jgi:hypothetical protein
MQPEPHSLDHRHGLISAILSFGVRWVVLITGMLWIVLSLAAAAAVASTAKSSNHWLGVFCLYAVIFILLPVVPYLGWIAQRRKHDYLKHHSRRRS